MARLLSFSLFALAVLVVSAASSAPAPVTGNSPAVAPAGESRATSFVRKTCDDATYISLCLDTLLPNAARINLHPKKAARLAIMATISGVQTAASKLQNQSKKPKLRAHEVAALNECTTMVMDSVLGLNQALEETQHLGGGSKSDKQAKRVSMEEHVSNVVDAANTCVNNMHVVNARDVLLIRVEDVLEPLVELATNAVDLIHRMQF
ncbi:hypothetical protein SOVF_138750 [Spinacia oleracea]|uniref:Pectinesterase inhibitor 11-like n=1 Tax=Spinacia oleracea TaxID=3562 RepID=A0A9R0JP41_SPIOL|nr:pectinesterase inhibitor 11-like [Spinacia oleracea]KNA11046.1 hypothetical protein SOVF_138750 [Spinacia oleracea]